MSEFRTNLNSGLSLSRSSSSRIPSMRVVGVAARLEDVVESDEVALHVGAGVDNRVAHARLGGEVDHDFRPELSEKAVDKGFIGYIALDEAPAAVGMAFGCLLNLSEAELLDAHVVIVVERVDSENFDARFGVEESQRKVGADKTGGSGNEYFHMRKLLVVSRV